MSFSSAGAFVLWAAEPTMDSRKGTGLWVSIFLLFATVLAYMAYQNLWYSAKRQVAPVGPLDPANKARRQRASRTGNGSGMARNFS
jgi:ubiquinol-cytochrome c reductase cytochrome c1 subunit